jgi:hypothetical protein
MIVFAVLLVGCGTATTTPISIPPGAESHEVQVSNASCARSQILPTGTYLIRRVRSGLGELTVQNGLDVDAVVQATRPNGRTVIAVYIRAGKSYTVARIPDGNYVLYFRTGRCWTAREGRFLYPQDSRRFERPLSFHTQRLATETRYSTFTVTLNGVVGGNAPTRSVSPPRLR